MTTTKHGYQIKVIRKKQYFVHRLIWERQYGKIPKGFNIHHIDGNKLNNDISNLLLVTPKEHYHLHKEKHKNIKYKRKNSTKLCFKCNSPINGYSKGEGFCKPCHERYVLICRGYQYIDDILYKRCSRCLEFKIADSNFLKSKLRFQSRCNSCRKEEYKQKTRICGRTDQS